MSRRTIDAPGRFLEGLDVGVQFLIDCWTAMGNPAASASLVAGVFGWGTGLLALVLSRIGALDPAADALAGDLLGISVLCLLAGAIFGVFGLRAAKRSGGVGRRLATVAMWLSGAPIVLGTAALSLLVLLGVLQYSSAN